MRAVVLALLLLVGCSRPASQFDARVNAVEVEPGPCCAPDTVMLAVTTCTAGGCAEKGYVLRGVYLEGARPCTDGGAP